MAKTNAERQAEYRARTAETGDQRFSAYLPQDVHFGLEKLAEYHGLSMRDALSGLVRVAHKNLFRKTTYEAHALHLDEVEKGR